MVTRCTWRLGAVLVLISNAGCSSPNLIDTGRVAIVESTALPPPSEADLVAGIRPRLIGPGDAISVEDGEVTRPGVYPILGQATLMRPIARAEGTSDIGDATRVVVFGTVEGQPMAALYDLRTIRLGAYNDPQIYANDVVVVGESAARRIFPQIASMSSLLISPLVAILQN